MLEPPDLPLRLTDAEGRSYERDKGWCVYADGSRREADYGAMLPPPTQARAALAARGVFWAARCRRLRDDIATLRQRWPELTAPRLGALNHAEATLQRLREEMQELADAWRRAPMQAAAHAKPIRE